MKKGIITLIAFMFLLVSACNQESPAFVGEWILEKMELDSEIIYANVLGNPSYIFNADKSYVVKASAQSEEGKWSYDGENIVLRSDNLQTETIIKIKEVNDTAFVYIIGTPENQTVVYLKK